MDWSQVAKSCEVIEQTPLRNRKTEILAQMFSKVSPEEAAQLCYLVMGRLVPLYETLELGVAEKQLVRAVAAMSGRGVDEVGGKFKQVGDLGVVVEELAKSGRDIEESLTVGEVYEKLLLIAGLSGAGSQGEKISELASLLRQLSPQGAKYLVRLVGGKLRLGFSDMTLLDALSWARKGSKEDRGLLERGYSVTSDIGNVARVYLQDPAAVAKMEVVPGVPVLAMRAERLGTFAEIVEKLGECAVEPKLDGMRVQIHAYRGKSKTVRTTSRQAQLFGVESEGETDQIRIFSRGLEDITGMFPEIVAAARELMEQAGSFVLDGEAIGVLPSGKFLPFQETMKRKRKYGIAEKALETPLKVFVFDILSRNGEDTLRRSYRERRQLLTELLTKKNDEVLVLAESIIMKDEDEIREKFETAVAQGLEGVLIKKLESVYRAGARDYSWVKYKRAHDQQLSDTIDAVVIGAYAGKGKRNKFGVGAFLVGVLAEERVVTVAKIGTGLSDEQFNQLFQMIEATKVKSGEQVWSGYEVPKALTPDVWVRPEIVVEIEADEITTSPLHSSGYALRFPRLLRFRQDKNLNEITKVDEVVKLQQMMRG